jgi:MFS family permease
LETRIPALVVLAIVLSLTSHDILYGPQAALIAESFPGKLRYSGASLGYQLSSVIAGGPAPLIATWLLGTYHSGMAIAVFILFCSIVSLVATSRLEDHTNQELAHE